MDIVLLTSLTIIGLCVLAMIGLGFDRWRQHRAKHAHR